MRSYPDNSPEAAARIVALVLISDGHACNSEFEALQEANVARSLGLEPQSFLGIVQTLCEDLLMEGFNGGSIMSYVDDGSIASLLAEVGEPVLRDRVLRAAVLAAHADRHLADGEALVLNAICRHWGLGILTRVAKCETPEVYTEGSWNATSVAHP